MAKAAAAAKPKSTARKSTGLYDVHPGVAMVQKWIGELKEKTGRTIDEWVALVQKDGPKTGHKSARPNGSRRKHEDGEQQRRGGLRNARKEKRRGRYARRISRRGGDVRRGDVFGKERKASAYV